MITDEAVVPVHSLESERYVIGAVLWHRDAIHQVADTLRPEHFYGVENRKNWQAILDVNELALTVDVDTVAVHRRVTQKMVQPEAGMCVFELSMAKQGSFGAVNIGYHAAIIIQLWAQREGVRIAASAVSHGQDESTDPIDFIEGLRTEAEHINESFIRRHAVSFAEAEADEIEKGDGVKKPLHTTGFAELDTIIGGYQRGDLTIIAARPGMGKTAFMVSSASIAAERGHHVGVFSMELVQAKFQARLFSRRSGVPLATIVRDEMQAADISKRHASLSDGVELPMWIRYDTALTLSDIRAEATRMVRAHGVTCIYIDQLNWITPPRSGNRDGEVGMITRGLKQMAMQLDVAVVLLHQLSRDVERRGGDKRPKLHDLRDSGNVEQDAQVVIFLYRAEYYKITEDQRGSTIGTIEAIVEKNSNGGNESAWLAFDASTASVRDMNAQHNYAQSVPHPDNRNTSEDIF
jgi:replicative DNA helicase